MCALCGCAQGSITYTADAAPTLGEYPATLGVLGFLVDNPYSGLHVNGYKGGAACSAADTYSIAPSGVNASAAVDKREFFVTMTTLLGSVSPARSFMELVANNNTNKAVVEGKTIMSSVVDKSVHIGEDVSFLITAKDVFDHTVTTRALFAVDTTLRGVSSLKDNQDGTYTAVVRGTELGLMPVHVRVATDAGEVDVTGSPMYVEVMPPVCHGVLGQTLTRDQKACECLPGFEFIPASGACQPCGLGTAKSVAGDTACAACTGGFVAEVTGLLRCTVRHVTQCRTCLLCDDFLTVCCLLRGVAVFFLFVFVCAFFFFPQACPAGTTPAPDGRSCIACRAGLYAPSVGMSTCLKCATGSFSYAGAKECMPCPSSGVVCEGGLITELLPGFWRDDPSEPITSETVFYPCPNEAACDVDTAWFSGLTPAEVGESPQLAQRIAQDYGFNVTLFGLPSASGNVTCSPETTGPMCAVCVDGYAGLGGVCSKCWDPEYSWAATGTIALMVIAVVVFMVHKNTRGANEAGRQAMLAALAGRRRKGRRDVEVDHSDTSSVTSGGQVSVTLSVLSGTTGATRATGRRAIRDAASSSGATGAMRILINFLQASSMLGSFRIKGPALVAEILGFSKVGDGVSLDAFPVQCAIGLTYYQQFYAYLALPLLVIAVAALVAVFTFVRARHKISKLSPRRARRVLNGSRLRGAIVSRFVTTVLIVMFLVHNRLTKEIVSVFSTFPQAIRGHTVLAVDYSIDTATTEYAFAAMLGTIAMGVYVLGFPVFTALVLWKNRRKLHTMLLRTRYGFLYQGLRLDAARPTYMYEVLVMLRKVAIVVVAVVVTDPFLQIWCASLILGTSLVTHLSIRPYDSKIMNALEGASLGTMLLTQMGSILYWREEGERLAREGSNTLFDTIVTASLIGLNLLMFLVFIGTIIYMARRRSSTAGKAQAPKQVDSGSVFSDESSTAEYSVHAPVLRSNVEMTVPRANPLFGKSMRPASSGTRKPRSHRRDSNAGRRSGNNKRSGGGSGGNGGGNGGGASGGSSTTSRGRDRTASPRLSSSSKGKGATRTPRRTAMSDRPETQDARRPSSLRIANNPRTSFVQQAGSTPPVRVGNVIMSRTDRAAFENDVPALPRPRSASRERSASRGSPGAGRSRSTSRSSDSPTRSGSRNSRNSRNRTPRASPTSSSPYLQGGERGRTSSVASLHGEFVALQTPVHVARDGSVSRVSPGVRRASRTGRR